MFPIAISEGLFGMLFLAFAFSPFLLPVCLFPYRSKAHKWFIASFSFFLPGLLIIGLWVVTNGQTEPKLGDIGVGLMLFSAAWVLLTCLLSLSFGVLCVRTYRWALLWLVPEVLLSLALGYFLHCAYH